MILATWVTRQLVFDGIVSGLVFGLLAMGIVLVYRATKVINFAVGNMGLVGAGLFVLLAVQYDVPYWLAAAAGLAVGVLYGAAVELVVVRRLFTAPRVIVLVATIGIAQLSLAILSAYPDVDVRGARFPLAIGAERHVLGVRVTGAQLMIVVVVPLVAATLGWAVTRTTLGRTVAASADNGDLARLSGINPKVVSTFVWAAAGLLATLSLTLVAGPAGSVQGLDKLGPSTLVRALAAAVIAGMASFPRALVAGVAIGVVQAIVQFNWIGEPGLVDLLLLVAVLVAVYLQSRAGADDGSFSFAPTARPVPERARDRWWARQVDRAGLALLGVMALVAPLVVEQPSRQLLYTSILGFALCGLSVTVLTGWAGQLSLGQMAFAGIGALLGAGFERGMSMNVGWHDTRVVNARLDPLPYGLAVVLGVLVTSALAALIGAGALRVRGLLLAVSTFAFAVAASQYLYGRPLLTGGAIGPVSWPRTDLLGIDLSSQRSFYYLALAVLAVCLAMVARLRRTGVGRTTIGVRDNPDGAAAYTVPAARTKLRAFALAGGLAALGGIVLAGSVGAIPDDRFFTVDDSLNVVAIAVIGGLGSVSGAVIGSLWVVGLPAFFPDSEVVPLLTSSIGLLVLLLYVPGGFVQIAYAGRDALLARLDGRTGAPPARVERPAPRLVPASPAPREPGRPALDVRDVTVRFGGLVAVDGATLRVEADEVVGLIGTNGAGKSTLMNAIGGFVPATGVVELHGDDLAGTRAAARARKGLGRTFQAATLFPELTVRETVSLALEARGRAGLLSSALWLPRSVRGERAKRAEADDLIELLGLGRYADTLVAELSTGTRRIVELAGLLALDARALCLDEPTAGVAQRETEAFGPLILEVRRQLGASMLVIEHDMPLIMGISDRVYCLEAGRVIAAGPPATVRDDPAVVASYLGTDERAIARSGAAAI
jgi:ABC-type branched-subunit amino acid transport system ATPase component/ABC-type branched-subunit amino acid transport system permease subunit